MKFIYTDNDKRPFNSTLKERIRAKEEQAKDILQACIPEQIPGYVMANFNISVTWSEHLKGFRAYIDDIIHIPWKNLDLPLQYMRQMPLPLKWYCDIRKNKGNNSLKSGRIDGYFRLVCSTGKVRNLKKNKYSAVQEKVYDYEYWAGLQGNDKFYVEPIWLAQYKIHSEPTVSQKGIF